MLKMIMKNDLDTEQWIHQHRINNKIFSPELSNRNRLEFLNVNFT